MKPTRRKSKFAVQEDSDPLSVVVNLFDVAMVFAVALMVAMVMHTVSYTHLVTWRRRLAKAA